MVAALVFIDFTLYGRHVAIATTNRYTTIYMYNHSDGKLRWISEQQGSINEINGGRHGAKYTDLAFGFPTIM